MPRAALLSLHARLTGVDPSTLDDPSLAQLWGPRYNTYVVPKRDFALFSLGRLPDNERGRLRAERIAEQLHTHLDGRRMTDREAGRALSMGNEIRYASTTGTIAIRWDGARAPEIWTVAAADIEPADACRELARRYLHIFGPTRLRDSPAGPASRGARGLLPSRRSRNRCCPSDRRSVTSGCSPTTSRRCRPPTTATAAVRLLPSGDAYFLLDRAERELLVPSADQRQRLWTPRVWPGALLVDGEIRGTWRRAQHTIRIETWSRLAPNRRAAIEAEAASLPLPGIDREIEVVWSSDA